MVKEFVTMLWQCTGGETTELNYAEYADRSSKDEQLLFKQFLRETKNTNVEGSRKLKSVFYFMERTHEQLHLSNLRPHGHDYNFYLNRCFVWLNL
jgi:hypothetical protein